MDTPALIVSDNPERNRYEIVVAGAVAGFADYTMEGTTMVLPHTVVDPAFRGRGFAAQLVRYGLDNARSRGLHVEPQCSYVAHYMADHPEYDDLRTHP